MKIIIEESTNSKGGLIYRKSYLKDNGEVEFYTTVDVKAVATIGEDGEKKFILYNSRREVITDVYRFINKELKANSPNTIESYLGALKILYSYLELFSMDLKNCTKGQWKNVVDFLGGLNFKAGLEFKNLTKRSADTINIYLGVYRRYLVYLGIAESPILIKKDRGFVKGNKGLLGHTEKQKVTSYQINQSVNKPYNVPKYINIDEFKKIIKHVRQHYTLREEIILRLMFENGLRLGEVLGLTLEDIQNTPEELSFKDDTDVGRINLVNRVSDENYQLAKNVYIPKSIEYYSSKYYQQNYISYVTPTVALLNLLDRYIEEAHGELSIKNRENYLSRASADFINRAANEFIDENYYIFLNKNGTPLAYTGWNKILRKIFKELGFVNDFAKRKNNLSHRFRHGYAMYLVKYKKYNELQLKEALRHRSLSSVQIYYNPTIEDIYIANKEVAEHIYSIVPELVEDFVYESRGI